EQSADWHNRIAARAQPFENTGKRGHRLRTISAGIMQQNDAAITALLFHSLNNDVGAWLRPILWVDVFEDDEIIQVLRDLQWHQLANLRTLRLSGVVRVIQFCCASGD